jgi:hypothetical protein
MFKTWTIQGTNISRLDLSGLQILGKSTGICMRSHYSICIKLPPNPSKKGRSGSEIRKRNQTADQITVERGGN